MAVREQVGHGSDGAGDPLGSSAQPDPVERGAIANLISQSDLDALFEVVGKPDTPVDAPLTVPDSAAPEVQPAEDDFESLIAEFVAQEKPVSADPGAAPSADSAGEPVASGGSEAAVETETPPADPIPKAMIEALLQEARSPEPVPAPPPPAPKTSDAATEPGSVASARQEPPSAQAKAPTVEPIAIPRKKRTLPRIPAKWIVSVAAGAAVGLNVFGFLQSHPWRSATPEAMRSLQRQDLASILPVATNLIELGKYAEAVKNLDTVLADAPDGPLRAEAEHARIEAVYRLLPADAKIPLMEALRSEIDDYVAKWPDHGGAVETLRWKAELLTRSDSLQGAYDTYAMILRKYPESPERDAVLYEAAQSALAIGRAGEAVEVLRRMAEDYPESPLAADGQALLGKALAEAGDVEGARELLIRTANANPGSTVGATAALRLGEMSFEEGRFDEAIQLLESRLRTATRVDGNDHIYLLLARAHRAKGDFASAERILRELIDFFPESGDLAQAMVHLSQVLEEQGRRDEAVRLAKQAAGRFEHDAEALENAARFLAEAGQSEEAAQMFLAAADEGLDRPRVILEAARAYRAATLLPDSVKAYERLIEDSPQSPEAQEGSVELARVLFEQGRVREALERLESQAVTAKGAGQRVAVLSSLAALYADLGMRDRAVEAYREAVRLTSDSGLLAQAAVALFRAEAWEDGLAVAARVDEMMVSPDASYDFLMSYGEALLKSDPVRGIARMEQAYRDHPDKRTPEDGLRLLKAELTLNRSADARAMVMDLGAHVETNPAEVPQLVRAASVLGDSLYKSGDLRGAAEAYEVGVKAPEEVPSAEGLWCRFQLANARLRLDDLQGSLPLYSEVAESESEWREAARSKAEYVKLEMRRRGMKPVEVAQGGEEES